MRIIMPKVKPKIPKAVMTSQRGFGALKLMTGWFSRCYVFITKAFEFSA